MDELVQAIANYGTGVICVAYLIYFQSTTMREMLKTLESINKRDYNDMMDITEGE